MSMDQWLIFVAIWTLATLPLGPNALNCIALSARAGFARSLFAVLGILIAALCHMTFVVLGAAAVLLANAEIFHIVKLCGAAYLVWMGFSMWRKGAHPPAAREAKNTSNGALVSHAILISMSNPKAILSYLAVFAQFLTPNEPLADRLIILVPTALVVVAAIYVGYCAIGTSVGRFLGTVPRRLAFNRTIATFYILAGASLAAADIRPIPGRGS